MIFLVGDVQGCDEALGRLLDMAAFSPSRDRLVLLGDLVNRGPASLAVLERVQALGDSAHCLLGNHDLHLLAVAHGVRGLHRGDTFDAVLSSPRRDALLEWLRQQRLALVESGWLCVHAGLVPQWSAADALALAAEVEAVLSGPALVDFLRGMYGNKPERWSDALDPASRLRFIVNVLTRIRFCTAGGVLDYTTKEGAGAAPEGYFPWFEAPQRKSAGDKVACGHWSTLGLVDRADLLLIDTGCVWGGALTAVRVDGGRREVLQVQCAEASRPGRSAQ